jgi:hypothetical protein
MAQCSTKDRETFALPNEKGHMQNFDPIARTLLEDICDKPIVIQSYCAVARLHGI